MRIPDFSKILAAASATVLLLGNLSGFPTQAAVQHASMNISKVEILKEAVAEDRLVAVDVRIDDNEEGFLAASFGIVYDDRLILEDVIRETSPGDVFTYTKNPNGHYAWFSGAAANSANTSTSGRQTLFTLMFRLPEDFETNDVYFISYSWDSSMRKPSFWYTDKGVNQIDWVNTHSIGGSIRIPDAKSPHLTYPEVQMNQRETAAIGILNFEGTGIWYTEHPEIAYFEDPTVGEITAVSPGTCTAYCLAGTTLLMCDVTVTDEYFYPVSGSSAITILDANSEVYMTYPDPVGSVIWVSTRPDIVSVSNNGKLTPLKNGECQIIGTNNSLSFARPVVVDLQEEETTEAPTEEPTEEFTGEQVIGTEPYSEVINYGDVNDDDNIDLVDVILLNKFLMIGTPLSDSGMDAADVVKDGTLDEVDSLTILKYVIRLVDALPVS